MMKQIFEKINKVNAKIEDYFPTEAKIILFIWWVCALLFVVSIAVLLYGGTMSVLEYWGVR